MMPHLGLKSSLVLGPKLPLKHILGMRLEQPYQTPRNLHRCLNLSISLSSIFQSLIVLKR
tara:strand:- start:1752 stop:1931 length:180 start_codon:yes stop_codon:yes gene_type:complete